MSFLCGLFEAIWRRCFGSDGWNIPILKNRMIQHLIGFLMLSLFLITKYALWQAILIAGVMQALYWARAVGMYQDIGRAGQPDEEMLKRYNNMWYNKFLDKWFSKNKYSIIYDWIGLMIRYTIPSIIVSIILLNPVFLLAGICVSSVYSLCWVFYDYGYIKNPTEYAECISGFITGFLLLS